MERMDRFTAMLGVDFQTDMLAAHRAARPGVDGGAAGGPKDCGTVFFNPSAKFKRACPINTKNWENTK